MNDDGSTANDAPAEGATDFQNPNDLATEMTDEQEQAFVDKTLGINQPKQEAKDDTDSDDNSDSGSADVNDKPADDNAEGDNSDAGEEKPEAKAEEDTADEEVAPETKEEVTDLIGPQTDDLWVEVEDAEGKSVKLVFDPANPGAFLPDDFTFKNDKQLFEILDAKAEMANMYKQRASEFEEKTTEQQQQEAAAQAIVEKQAGWQSEIDALVGAGALDAPRLTKPANGKAFTPEEIAADPALARIDEVFKYMGENKLQSFGTAYSVMSKAEAAKAEADAKVENNKVAKARGSLVGGTSSASSAGEKPMYVAGSAAKISDVQIDA